MGYPKLTPATAAVHDLLTCDVDRQRLNRFDIGYKACRIEKDLHIPVAPSIQSSRTQRKARQCIGPGLPIQLVLKFLGCRREDFPALLRMIDDVLSGFLCCGEKAPDCILIDNRDGFLYCRLVSPVFSNRKDWHTTVAASPTNRSKIIAG